MKQQEGHDVAQKKQKLAAVSPSFCLAKWTQVTLDLLHGANHSCHHPKRHNVDAEEVKKNPAALHNTAFKKEVRAQMLKGQRPAECSYCWNIEDAPGNHDSDRIVKSLDPWSWPYFEQVLECGESGDYAPHYLEVMFDNTCNFACSYCMADISSSVKKEMREFGRYPLQRYHHRMEDPQWQRGFKREDNPFVEAFWKWLPDIWTNLHVFRITGGEPLLSKHTYKVLDYCLENPQPKLELAINSNLGVERERLERFLGLIEKVHNQKALRSFSLYVSVDSVGEQAEYIRQGLDYDLFLHNLQIFLESKACRQVTLMVTFSVFSLPKIHQLVSEVKKLKEKYPQLLMDMSYLKDPEYLKANITSDEEIQNVGRALEIMKKSELFNGFERNKLQRIYNWLLEPAKDSERKDIISQRADFFSFVNEYDKRYQKNFLSTFPELRNFYVECKKARFFSGKITS